MSPAASVTRNFRIDRRLDVSVQRRAKRDGFKVSQVIKSLLSEYAAGRLEVIVSTKYTAAALERLHAEADAAVRAGTSFRSAKQLSAALKR